jgi:hypothetical protein
MHLVTLRSMYPIATAIAAALGAGDSTAVAAGRGE